MQAKHVGIQRLTNNKSRGFIFNIVDCAPQRKLCKVPQSLRTYGKIGFTLGHNRFILPLAQNCCRVIDIHAADGQTMRPVPAAKLIQMITVPGVGFARKDAIFFVR